ncbi:MAG TPA: 3'-5' exonuclease, partial [Gemmataceae bacterium]
PQDAVSLAGTLRSPFGCLSDEVLYVLARHPDGLWAGLHDEDSHARLPADDRAAADRSRRFLDRWREHKDRLPIAALLNLVLADCGYDAALQFEFLGDRKLANLWKLIDLARTFDCSGLFGVADFIARLGELVRSQPREEQAATLPEDANVVRLMSIHQAKGLEFPVVVLPDLAATTGGAHVPAARWDARLGCVARPPADEDPPLFSDFGWKLWQAREELADWYEDLRTLYVACTRAEDYLVLSASIPEPVRPVNTAITVLSERFHLDTGECRDAAIPESERPSVRVIGPDDSFEEAARPRREREPSPPLTATDLAAVAPIAVRRPAGAVMELAALEVALTQGDGGLFVHESHEGQVSVGPGGGPRERILRAVVRTWDFADEDGWQQPLADAVATERCASDPVRLRDDLAGGLVAFAASEHRRQVAGASELWRDVEFLFAWPLPGEAAPTPAGRIDLLWREADVGWRLMAWDAHPAVGRDPWQNRRPGLLATAWAVRQQVGEWPRSVGLFSFARRAATTLVPREPAVRAALRSLLPDPSR